MNDDPIRLVDDKGVPETTRAHLARAGGSSWVIFDSESALARLEAAIGASPAPRRARLAAKRLGWWGVAAAGLAGAGIAWALSGTPDRAAPSNASIATAAPIGSWTVSANNHESKPLPAPSAPPRPSCALSEPPAVDEEECASAARLVGRDRADRAGPSSIPLAAARRVTGGSAPSNPYDGATPEAPARARSAAHGAVSVGGPSDASSVPGADRGLAEEIEHLAALRRAAASDPARALALADEGRARFPRGYFAHEREFIAIRALARLGRRNEAAARGGAFLARYPRSPLRESVAQAAGIKVSGVP